MTKNSLVVEETLMVYFEIVLAYFGVLVWYEISYFQVLNTKKWLAPGGLH